MIPVPQFVFSLTMCLAGKMDKVKVVAATGSMWSLCLLCCVRLCLLITEVHTKPVEILHTHDNFGACVGGLDVFFFSVARELVRLPKISFLMSTSNITSTVGDNVADD